MSKVQRNWTRDETILAFELYCTIPSGQDTINNPLIIALSKAIGRTENSVKLKLQNFKSYDPSYVSDGRIGLAHGSKLDREICDEFLGSWDELVAQVQEIKNKHNLLEISDDVENDAFLPVGREVFITTRQRVGQSFFRRTLNASYYGMCCITGIGLPGLLRASHIKPWSKSNDINEKTNPQNGLLLNALHDAAFDGHVIKLLRKDSDKCSEGKFT